VIDVFKMHSLGKYIYEVMKYQRRKAAMKKRILSVILAVGLLASLCVGCSSGSGDEGKEDAKEESKYPEKEITMIIPWSAGGSTDTVSRKLASVMEKELGQSIVVQNTEGAGGNVGFSAIAQAKPDGYTIGIVSGTIILNDYFMDDSVPYDSLYNLAIFCENPSCIAVPADSEFETLDDFLAYAKENPGKLQVANAGIGSTWHGVACTLENKAGVEFKHVPYDGGNPAVTAAAGGHVDAVVCAISEASTLVDSGNLRFLATSSESVLSPDAPTFEECGVEGMFGAYNEVVAPKDIPEDVAQRLLDAVQKAYDSEDMEKFMNDGGFGRLWITGDELDQYLKDMDEAFSKIPTE